MAAADEADDDDDEEDDDVDVEAEAVVDAEVNGRPREDLVSNEEEKEENDARRQVDTRDITEHVLAMVREMAKTDMKGGSPGSPAARRKNWTTNP